MDLVDLKYLNKKKGDELHFGLYFLKVGSFFSNLNCSKQIGTEQIGFGFFFVLGKESM